MYDTPTDAADLSIDLYHRYYITAHTLIHKAYAQGRYPQKLGPGVVKMRQNH